MRNQNSLEIYSLMKARVSIRGLLSPGNAFDIFRQGSGDDFFCFPGRVAVKTNS